MNPSAKAKAVRSEIASDILSFIDILKANSILIETAKNISDTLKDFTRVPVITDKGADGDCWGYKTEVRLSIEEPRHIEPKGLQSLILEFSIDIIANSNKYCNDGLDPLEILEFNIVIIGYDKTGTQIVHSLHLDRHPDIGDSTEPHPKYHFQFGGRKLHEKIQNYGQAMFLDTPRIMHHPMDFILGMDFVLSNYFSNKWDEIRKKEHNYNTLVGKYQNILLKPYYKAMSDHWDTRSPFDSRNWNTQHICPQLVMIPKS